MKKKFVAWFSMAVIMSSWLVVRRRGQAQQSDKPDKLVVAARGGSHVTAMEAVKEAFEQEHQVEIEILGLEAADLKQKVSLDAKNSSGAYDLIMADDPWMPEFSEAGIFANLSEMGVEADPDFEQSSLALGRHPYETGDLYALPFAGNVQMFFYNKELLASHGFEVPQSWEEVLSIASAIHESDGVAGYVFAANKATRSYPIICRSSGHTVGNLRRQLECASRFGSWRTSVENVHESAGCWGEL